jgi:hypothetical protein
MSLTAEEILKHALELNEQERASVAGVLIESLHCDAEPGAAEAWDRVIEKRALELESGSVQTRSWSDVRQRLFRGFE